MAGAAKKRKAPSTGAEPTKRQRIENLHSLAVESEQHSDLDDDDLDFEKDADDFSEDDQTADTPLTPFSPSRKKFPSELKVLKCTYEGCTKSFNRPIRLQNHFKTHTNERSYLCTYDGCEKAYFEDKHLQQHIKGSHTHERKFQCDWEGCNKKFLTSTRLKRHKDAHQGHERFRCTSYPPCNETFRKHQTLQRHIRSEHLELAPYPCNYLNPITTEQCNAGFDGAGGLRKHQERVHGLVQFFCLECMVPNAFESDGSPVHLGFTTNALLQSHLRKEHANSSCMFCDLKCSSQRELQKHVESQHSGRSLEERKVFHCAYTGCGKSFTKKYNLTTHVRTAHMGERFICGEFDTSSCPGIELFMPNDGCGDDFVSKASLEDHIRTAHLRLPSVLNAHRKKVTSILDEGDDEDVNGGFKPSSKMKNRTRKTQFSAVEALIGEPYSMFEKPPSLPSNFEPPSHHEYAQLNTGLQASNRTDFNARFEWPNMPMGITSGLSNQSLEMQTQARTSEEDSIEELGAMYDQADLEWELQQRALEEVSGAFWFGGADESNSTPQLQNQDLSWAEEELEMRRLIGDNDFGGQASVYPTVPE